MIFHIRININKSECLLFTCLYSNTLVNNLKPGSNNYGSFHKVGARFVTVSIVTSVNVPSIILDRDS